MTKDSLFHEYIEDLINKSSIKQIDIAKELGYDSPNLITMFKQGKTRVPIDKVPLLANIFNIDPKKMLLRYLCEYQPVLLKIIDQYFGVIITKNEQDIINEIRRLSKGKDPGITSIKSKLAIENFVREISHDL
jgi:transcriptional regulator with XRE-family HTH domain